MNAVIAFVRDWWAFIGAVIGLCGAGYKYIVQPLERLIKQSEKNDKNLGDAIATLQHDRLMQSHRYYTERGWIEHYAKVSILEMFRQYTESGHNHLFKEYQADIVKLPEIPPDDERLR